MCTDKSNVNNLVRVIDSHYKTILFSLYVEYNTIVGNAFVSGEGTESAAQKC
jgi:hypothetical protein